MVRRVGDADRRRRVRVGITRFVAFSIFRIEVERPEVEIVAAAGRVMHHVAQREDRRRVFSQDRLQLGAAGVVADAELSRFRTRGATVRLAERLRLPSGANVSAVGVEEDLLA